MYISKIVFLTFAIFFSTLSFGADFRDLNLKIGGISLGDDLSLHLSHETIQRSMKETEDWNNHLKEPKKYKTVQVTHNKKINQTYGIVQFLVMEFKGKLIIHSISFIIERYTNMSYCERDLNKVVKQLSKKFPDIKKEGPRIGKFEDQSGNYHRYFFYDKNDNQIELKCSNYIDELRAGLTFHVDTLQVKAWFRDYD